MDSGKRVSVTFKPSRLAKVRESNIREEMTKKEKAGAAAGAGASAGAVAGPDRRGDIRRFLQAAPGVQVTVEGQMATQGKRKATPPRDQQPAKRTAQGDQGEGWKTMDAMIEMRNQLMDKSIAFLHNRWPLPWE